jgi:hypothetical protein
MNYKQTDWLGTGLAAVVIAIVVATYIAIIVLIYAATRDAPPIALDAPNAMSKASAAPPTTTGSSLGRRWRWAPALLLAPREPRE